MTDLSINQLNPEEFDFSSQIKLGEGGCGTVHKVNHGNNCVVLKKPKKDTSLSKKEISVLNQIRHKNIIKLHGLVSWEATSCLVLELAHYGSLKDVLYSSDPVNRSDLTLEMKEKWIKEMTCGLYYLHSHLDPPIYHGDIKSGNILIARSHDDTKIAKLADFGLSEPLIETSVGTGDCTHRWAAPEVLKTHEKSTKSDVWSLGATVWELFMEKYPFQQFGDGNGKEIIYQVIWSVGNGEVTPYNPKTDNEIPEAYREFLDNCFVFDHKKRWCALKCFRFLEDIAERGSGDVPDGCAMAVSLPEKKPHISDDVDDSTDVDTRYAKAVYHFCDLLEKDENLFSKVKELFRELPKGDRQRIKTPQQLIDYLEKYNLLSHSNSEYVQKRLRLIKGPGDRLANLFARSESGTVSDFEPRSDANFGAAVGSIDNQLGLGSHHPFKQSSVTNNGVELAQDEFGRMSLRTPSSENESFQPQRPRPPLPSISDDSQPAEVTVAGINNVIEENTRSPEVAFDYVASVMLKENFHAFARNLFGVSYYKEELASLSASALQSDKTRELLERWLARERRSGREPVLSDLVRVLGNSKMQRTASEVEKMEPRPR